MILLTRYKTDNNGTFGRLSMNCQFLCFTVERPITGDHPCIPVGVYDVEPYQSPSHGDVWLLKDVPDRSMIEIHVANRASELLGCIAPGTTLGEIGGIPAVLGSKKAFDMLKDTLPSEFPLTIATAYD